MLAFFFVLHRFEDSPQLSKKKKIPVVLVAVMAVVVLLLLEAALY
jgi:hypothetical protein